MVAFEQGREKICATCAHYTFQFREPEDREQGWAYCRYFKRHHPRQTIDEKSAGMRTCSNWK